MWSKVSKQPLSESRGLLEEGSLTESLRTPLLTACSFLTVEGNDDNEDTKVEDLEEPTQQ